MIEITLYCMLLIFNDVNGDMISSLILIFGCEITVLNGGYIKLFTGSP